MHLVFLVFARLRSIFYSFSLCATYLAVCISSVVTWSSSHFLSEILVAYLYVYTVYVYIYLNGTWTVRNTVFMNGLNVNGYNKWSNKSQMHHLLEKNMPTKLSKD